MSWRSTVLMKEPYQSLRCARLRWRGRKLAVHGCAPAHLPASLLALFHESALSGETPMVGNMFEEG
eukprot:8321326-Heterocapsa_arctica.AAC.1